MDLTSTKCYSQSPTYFTTTQLDSSSSLSPPQFNGGDDKTIYVKNNPFAVVVDTTFTADPLCKLNLKETSEFVKSFPTPSSSISISSSSSSTANNNNVNRHDEKRRDSSATRKIEQQYSPAATPGRPVFSFSNSNSSSNGMVKPRKSIPSKWDDAEKWLFGTAGAAGGGGESSPATQHHHGFHVVRGGNVVGGLIRQHSSHGGGVLFVDKSQNKGLLEDLDFHNNPEASPHHQHVLLKDKVTNEVDNKSLKPSHHQYTSSYSSDPTKESFLFKNHQSSLHQPMKDASTGTTTEHHHHMMISNNHRDIGTEMTPLGSSTTSTCHTPIKSNSPARHNTPINRSGPLPMSSSTTAATTCSNHQIHDVSNSQFQEFHLANKLQQIGGNMIPFSDSVSTTNWSTREEEEEDVSKSLRHFEIRRSVSENNHHHHHESTNNNNNNSRGGGCAAWDDDEKTKFCLRYQREEARIQAWVNLQNAKAEAQSRKLEVKIEKMRSDLEERLMKRMAVVHKKAEEWRAAALLEHSEQIKKANERVNKSRPNVMNRRHSSQINRTNCYASCGCLPCNNLLL